MKDAHEPHLSKMERLNNKISESVKQVKSKIFDGDEKLQKVLYPKPCLLFIGAWIESWHPFVWL